MQIVDLHSNVIIPALQLLPAKMGHQKAILQLGATAIQESNLQHRRQHPTGPARSFWQMEPIAIQDVVTRPSSIAHARALCQFFDVRFNWRDIYDAIQHGQYDVFACALARLNYWNDITSIPDVDQIQRAWNYYIRVWRPGKPRPDHWPESYWRAYGAIVG
jgi:hypothetical protein